MQAYVLVQESRVVTLTEMMIGLDGHEINRARDFFGDPGKLFPLRSVSAFFVELGRRMMQDERLARMKFER